MSLCPFTFGNLLTRSGHSNKRQLSRRKIWKRLALIEFRLTLKYFELSLRLAVCVIYWLWWATLMAPLIRLLVAMNEKWDERAIDGFLLIEWNGYAPLIIHLLWELLSYWLLRTVTSWMPTMADELHSLNLEIFNEIRSQLGLNDLTKFIDGLILIVWNVTLYQ